MPPAGPADPGGRAKKAASGGVRAGPAKAARPAHAVVERPPSRPQQCVWGAGRPSVKPEAGGWLWVLAVPRVPSSCFLLFWNQPLPCGLAPQAP